jgi:putative hydrolase of the HAD superfamily
MFKNVIFDLGNVLVQCHFERFFECYKIDKIDSKLSLVTPIYESFNRGEISKNIFLIEMKNVLATDDSLEKIAYNWGDIFTLNREMVQLAETVKKKYKIFIFSNTDEIHFSRIINDFPELAIFGDNFILSYEIGELKPNIEAFKLGLEKFSLSAAETLFIDDRMENVNGAKIFGMDTIHHLGFEFTNKILKLKLD